MLAAVIMGVSMAWYFGLIFFLVTWAMLLVGYSFARCPRCGQVWGPGVARWLSTGRLDIGLGLRE